MLPELTKKTALQTALFIIALVLVSNSSFAGSLREVALNIEKVKSIVSPFQFAIIGDSRDGDKVYTQLLQHVLARKPKFILHLGDMVAIPSERTWKGFFELSKVIDVPFFPVVGNHDTGTTRLGEEMYRKQFVFPEGRPYYSFRAGAALFVALDSETGRGKILEDQWAWLENELSSSKEALRVIFLHRPLFLPSGSFKKGHAMDKYPADRDNLHRLFVKRNVQAVFQADDHRYDRTKKDEISYVISGGGGAPIWTLQEEGGYFHYLWLSMEKGRLEAEAIDLQGKVQDRFIIE